MSFIKINNIVIRVIKNIVWVIKSFEISNKIIRRYTSYLAELIIKSEMRSFKSNENIHKKEGGSYYVVSANKASSVTL